jgi:hypothetical protein|tara:strand:+ start:942 stop:1346 length:405 start_codon:yes stop_codon:yes gene_type:complete
MDSSSKDRPKIIIDEDWKSQVEEEKESLQQEKSADPVDKKPADEDFGPMPPASLTTLVMTLATQAMAALGQIPDESGKQPEAQLDYGKHLIDTLAILEEKTQGNLTTEEAAMVENTLHQLRMLYVAVENQSTTG